MALSWPLFLAFTKRELQSRFADSNLGLLWALLGPLILLSIYAVVFGQIFTQRGVPLGTESYTLFVALALWPWMIFSDGISRGMQAVQANASLVKKVAFPHFLLVASAVSAAFVLHLIGYICVLVALSVTGSPIRMAGIPWAAAYLVIIYLLTLGAASGLAALQTIIRDVEQAINPAIMMLHYLTPVLYPIAMLPEEYRGWLSWNPLAVLVTSLRDALLNGGGPGVIDLWPLACALLVLSCGLWMFARLSPFFEDFL